MNQKEKTQSSMFVPLRHFTEKSFLNNHAHDARQTAHPTTYAMRNAKKSNDHDSQLNTVTLV